VTNDDESSFTTSNKQDSTFTKDNITDSDVSQSISSRHEGSKQSVEPPVKSRSANYIAKGAINSSGTRAALHLYDIRYKYLNEKLPSQLHIFDFSINQKGYEHIEKINDKQKLPLKYHKDATQ
jgi:hypothetical protein